MMRIQGRILPPTAGNLVRPTVRIVPTRHLAAARAVPRSAELGSVDP